MTTTRTTPTMSPDLGGPRPTWHRISKLHEAVAACAPFTLLDTARTAEMHEVPVDDRCRKGPCR